MHWHRPTQLHSACQQQRRKLYILPKSCIARSPPPPHPPPRAPRYLRPQTLPWPLLPKPQTNTINTMPLIRRRRIPLALKNMPQMASTVTAHNLRPLHPKRPVHVPRHRPRDAVEIRRPPAAGLELVRRLVERCGAARARVDARGGGVFVVAAGEGRLGAFLAEDAELFCCGARAG